jgi:hypothetical protein
VLRKAGLREQVMVDCSHANSAKQHRRQIEVAADVAAQIAGGERRIVGVMVESHLHEGRQDLCPASRCAPACRSPTPASAGTTPSRCCAAAGRAVKTPRVRRERAPGAHRDDGVTPAQDPASRCWW